MAVAPDGEFAVGDEAVGLGVGGEGGGGDREAVRAEAEVDGVGARVVDVGAEGGLQEEG